MLLSNALVNDSQRVSILAAASPSENVVGPQATNDQFLSAVTYNSIASVVKQCDASSVYQRKRIVGNLSLIHI